LRAHEGSEFRGGIRGKVGLIAHGDHVARGNAAAPGGVRVLVGDDAQLPPVGIDYSPALDPAELLPYGDVDYNTMDEVVRQTQDSGILFNATMLRCMLENRLYEIPRFDMSHPDFRSVQGNELLEALEECYSKYGRDETIVITRSNKRANRYNEGIRRYNLSAEEEIESGDMLMIVKNNYFYAEHDEHSPMSFVANGDVVRLKRIRRFEEFYGFRFIDAVVEFPDYDDYTMEAKVMLDTLASESPSLTREESRKLFYEVEKDYEDIKSRTKRYRAIRENQHFNAMQVKFAYAVTCHKAQGGQWKAVFVDRCLFGDEEMSRDMMRWLYTAITRATERVYLVNFDEKFLDNEA
jgi:exodeoxyribonuclease-5